jgi:hypothetical protein
MTGRQNLIRRFHWSNGIRDTLNCCLWRHVIWCIAETLLSVTMYICKLMASRYYNVKTLGILPSPTVMLICIKWWKVSINCNSLIIWCKIGKYNFLNAFSDFLQFASQRPIECSRVSCEYSHVCHSVPDKDPVPTFCNQFFGYLSVLAVLFSYYRVQNKQQNRNNTN